MKSIARRHPLNPLNTTLQPGLKGEKSTKKCLFKSILLLKYTYFLGAGDFKGKSGNF